MVLFDGGGLHNLHYSASCGLGNVVGRNAVVAMNVGRDFTGTSVDIGGDQRTDFGFIALGYAVRMPVKTSPAPGVAMAGDPDELK